MKAIYVLLLVPLSLFGQEQAPQPVAVSRNAAVTLADPAQKELAWIAISPSGGVVSLPISASAQAFGMGYEALTIGDLTDEIAKLEKENADLRADYDLLAQRFNRLSSVSVQAAPPVRTSKFQRIMNGLGRMKQTPPAITTTCDSLETFPGQVHTDCTTR